MKKPKILQRCKVLSIPGLIIAIILLLSYKYIDIIQDKRKEIINTIHVHKVSSMKEKLHSMIQSKQKATVAMAISIANDSSLADDIENKTVNQDYYSALISGYRKQTLYKSIWIRILDKDLNSLYRSWSKFDGEDIIKDRPDFRKVFVTKEPIYSISSDRYNLSIKAIVPILIGNEIVGALEVISHFDSIAKLLQNSDIESVLVLDKKNSKLVTHPFTNFFIDEHYVANSNALDITMEHLKKNGIKKYFNDSYVKENGYLIASYPIKDVNKRIIAHYIMLEKLEKIETSDSDFFIYKWMTIGIIVLMSIAIIASVMLFYFYRKDKKYYQNIIDKSKNMILIYDRYVIKEVNKRFFKYFHMYSSLEDFKNNKGCICDYFVEQEGYLRKNMNGTPWIDFMLNHRKDNHKIKMRIDGEEYYFSASASIVSEDDQYVSIVITNISEQERYKNDLEHLTITDPLSGINNRRYFQLTIEEEISRAKRYKHSLSLIIFDIDFFKKVNDKYGHKVGDEVIIEYSRFISEMLREEDTFCRIGGEEFIIILPHIDRSKAFKVAEKLRASVEDSKKILPITMSFGVVEYIMGEEAESVFHRADVALYAAKDSGRNRVKIG